MRTLTGILALTLVLAAACTADEPAASSDVADIGVVVDTPSPGSVASNDAPYIGRTLVHEVIDTAAPTAPPTPELPETTSHPVWTGEPWLAQMAPESIVAADPTTDPRLDTLAERVPPSDGRLPLAVAASAERPERPHDHTHDGTQ